jgi:hypothetical protein
MALWHRRYQRPERTDRHPKLHHPSDLAGANADSLGAGSRQSDNTHFTPAGLASLTTLIVAAMAASGAPF